ncbi:TPA: hypothetical protein ACSG64_005101, partial [Escherichia coli]
TSIENMVFCLPSAFVKTMSHAQAIKKKQIQREKISTSQGLLPVTNTPGFQQKTKIMKDYLILTH